MVHVRGSALRLFRPLLTYQAAVILLAISAYQLCTRVALFGDEPVDPSLLQFLLFPAVLLAFAYIRFGAIRLPRLLLALALIGVLAGAVSTYQVRESQSRSPYLTTRFEGDRFGSISKRFRGQLSQRLAVEGVPPLAHHHGQVVGHVDALQLLLESPALKGVIWRAGNRLMFSTRTGMGEEEDKFYREHLKFRKRVKRGEESEFTFEVVRDIPIFSLSYKPRRESARFLASLIAAKEAPTAQLRESLLTAARDQASFWSGFEHRAYAALLLGNYHLDQAFANLPLQIGEVSCALESYNRGLGFVPGGKNPELRAALLNNKAVTLAAKGFSRGEDGDLKRAKEHFHMGLQAARHRNRYLLDYRAPYISGMNMHRLKKMRQQLND